jgi:predicted Zn-dependent protease
MLFKTIASFFCLAFMSASLLFAGGGQNPSYGLAPRKDFMNGNSHFARMKLQRAQHILATLVPDPQSYHLVLSSKSVFGGEAYPPGAFSEKPTMVLYQGALSSNHSTEEVAFMMAHELGHFNLHHMQNTEQQMEKIFNGPSIGISGTTFTVFHQKLQEREADLYGLQLYKNAGYSLALFPHTLNHLTKKHHGPGNRHREPGSLSMKDPHFSMKERFALLVTESQKMI